MALGWGNNNQQQLLNSRNADVQILLPQTVAAGSDVALQSVISADYDAVHGCVATEEGEVACWGDNTFGQLGREPLDPSLGVGRVTGLGVSSGIPISAVGVGGQHTCALTESGEIYCWGRNQYGQAGADGDASDWRPHKVEGFPVGTVLTAVSLGDHFTCALSQDAAVYCWGHGANGQLARESASSTSLPQPIGGLPEGVGFTSISAGSRHACASATDGNVYCWGMNSDGQTGVTPDQARVTTPTAVVMPPDAGPMRSVSAGRWHTCALSEAGRVFCWGNNASGQLGDGTQVASEKPVAVTGQSEGVPQLGVTAGGSHSCSWGNDSSVYCWGSNDRGQLGDGTVESKLSAVRTASGDTEKAQRPALSVSAGRDGNVALYGYATKPGQPQNASLEGSTLSWSPPLYPGAGGEPLSQYRVTLIPPGDAKPVVYATVPGNVTAMDLAGSCPQFGICSSSVGLDQGQTYRWTVTSVGGDGAASAASRSVSGVWGSVSVPPVEKPGSPPSSPFIIGLDGTTLSWTYPDFVGEGPTNLAAFSVRIAVAGDGSPREYMSIPASTTSIDLAGPCPIGGVCKRPIAPLVSGVGYEMRVYAVGANGVASTWPRGVQSSYFVWP